MTRKQSFSSTVFMAALILVSAGSEKEKSNNGAAHILLINNINSDLLLYLFWPSDDYFIQFSEIFMNGETSQL